MSFFVAVIFWCYGESCSFAYSSNMYGTKNDCMRSLDSEMTRMAKIEPGLKMNGSCLEMKNSQV